MVGSEAADRKPRGLVGSSLSFRVLKKDSFASRYYVTKRDFRRNLGAGFLDRFGNSPSGALSAVYKDFVFSKGKFNTRTDPERYHAWLRRRWEADKSLATKDELFWKAHERGLKVILGDTTSADKERREPPQRFVLTLLLRSLFVSYLLFRTL